MNFVLYLTEEYIKNNTNITQNVDAETIRPAMMKAQDLHITPFLGTTLDAELKNALINNTLTPIQNELLVLIRKAQAEFTAYLCYTDLFIKFLNKGVVMGGVQNGQIVTKSDIVFLRDITKNQAEFYLQRVKCFLEENSSSFPNYNCSNKSAFKFQIEYNKCSRCKNLKCICNN